jgi:hypothetical protein
MSTTLPSLLVFLCFVEVFYCSVVIVLFFFWSVAIVLALTVFVSFCLLLCRPWFNASFIVRIPCNILVHTLEIRLMYYNSPCNGNVLPS